MEYSNIFFLIAWFLIVLYILLWVVQKYLKRRILTVLTFTVLMQLGLPLLLMYPFAFSERNIKSTGGYWYNSYLPYINEVLIISIVGIIFFFLGVILANSTNKARFSYKFEESFSNVFITLTKTKGMLLFGFFIIFIYLILLVNGVAVGDKGLRTYAMQNGNIRPIYNVFTSTLPLFIGLVLLSINKGKSLLSIVLLLVAVSLGLATGSRTTAFTGVLYFILTILFIAQTKKSILLRTMSFGFIFLIIMMYVSDYRTGQTNILQTLQNLTDKIFFDNTFSDFRDTAWIMAGWDGSLLWGKTQLSGLLGFIPSSIIPFRSEWSLGVFTTSQVGLDSSVHPGLRPIIFGEPYFNFGYLGVITFATFYGFVIGRFSLYANYVLLNSEEINIKKIRIFTSFFLAEVASNIMITAGFFYVYVIILIYLFTLFVKKIATKKSFS